ncbi:MAG: peptidylprolyl isomerase [Hyphomicrobiales bacterium]|nr:peptidylprolyl isomerase [Hyphomicrobiales bacterium]
MPLKARARQAIRALGREPLAQFFVIGLVLFALARLTADDRTSERQIRVTQDVLIEFVQNRSRDFAPQSAARRLAALTPEERRALAEEYVREELLYREALKLGLEQHDYVIRRRLAQKLEFVAAAMVPHAPPDDAALQAYYAQHKADYRLPPRTDFAHIFFDAETRGGMAAAERAASALHASGQLADAGFSDALSHGDRFAFGTNFIARDGREIASLFSPAFRDAVAALTVQRWSAPLASPYGVHLVYVQKRAPQELPAWQELRPQLAHDMMRRARARAVRRHLDTLKTQYEIEHVWHEDPLAR